jgi:predicted nucleotidyltransferase
MARRSIEKAQRYQRGYAVLLTQISRLVMLARQDSNIGAMILYGSLARLNPHLTSDVDLLLLCKEPQTFIQAEEASGRGMYMIVEATSPEEEWPLAPQVTDLGASDLPIDLLNNIAKDGVLLYQGEGTALPGAMAELTPYEHWVARVENLMDLQLIPQR